MQEAGVGPTDGPEPLNGHAGTRDVDAEHRQRDLGGVAHAPAGRADLVERDAAELSVVVQDLLGHVLGAANDEPLTLQLIEGRLVCLARLAPPSIQLVHPLVRIFDPGLQPA